MGFYSLTDLHRSLAIYIHLMATHTDLLKNSGNVYSAANTFLQMWFSSSETEHPEANLAAPQKTEHKNTTNQMLQHHLTIFTHITPTFKKTSSRFFVFHFKCLVFCFFVPGVTPFCSVETNRCVVGGILKSYRRRRKRSPRCEKLDV